MSYQGMVNAKVFDGLVLWFDLSDKSIINPGLPASQAVQRLNDKSLSNKDLYQSNASYKPQYGLNKLNGLDTLTFQTDDALVSLSNQLLTGDMTIFLIINNLEIGPPDTYFIAGHANPSGAGSENNTLWSVYSNGVNYGMAWHYGTKTIQFSSSNIPVSSNPTIIAAIRDSVSKEIYFKINDSVDTVAYSNNTSGGSNGKLVLGRLDPIYGGSDFNGDLATVAVFNKKLNLTEFNQFYNSLKTKWGIS